MALTANEKVRGQSPVQDPDGRLIVVGPDGVPIGGGGGGSDPLSDGTDTGALPSKTLWIAGADGSVLRGVRVDSSGRIRTVVEGTPSVSVSNFPATQPISGALTDTQLRASAVPVSGPLTDTQLRASAVPVSGPLTDAQLRASAVPVSGSLTDTQLRASAVPVSVASAPQIAVNNVETLADNAGFTDGTSKLFPQGYIFDEAAGTALTENDVAAARIDSKRAIVNVLEDATTRGRRAIISATGGLLGDQGVPASQANAWYVRPRKLATYSAAFKVAARPYNLGFTFTANTRKQYATIHHAASATKTVRIRRVQVYITSAATVAPELSIELVRITTAPATGNPAITPAISDNADAAAEATCLALPTTAATEGATFTSKYVSLGITTTPPTTNPPLAPAAFELLEPGIFDDESKAPVIRAGVLEGWSVTIDSTTASGVFARVHILFTEE